MVECVHRQGRGVSRASGVGSTRQCWLVLAAVAFVAACAGPGSSSVPASATVRGTAPLVQEERSAGPAPPSAAPSREGPAPDTGTVRRDLDVDERRGGHTLARHVGRTDDQLRARLVRESIAAASTYLDRATAERVVAATLDRLGDRVARWVSREGARPNLALAYRGDPARPIGRTLRRGARSSEPAHHAVVVLRWDQRHRDFYVLTSYPEDRR